MVFTSYRKGAIPRETKNGDHEIKWAYWCVRFADSVQVFIERDVACV